MPSWQWSQAGRHAGADQYDSWWAYHEPDPGNAAGGFSWAADAYELGWQYTPAPATSGYDDDSAWTGDLAGAAATASFNLAGPGATGGCNDGSTWWPPAQAGVSSNLLGDSGAAAGLLGSNLAAGPGAKAAGNGGSSWWPDAPAAGISNLAGDSGPTAAGLGSTLGPLPGGLLPLQELAQWLLRLVLPPLLRLAMPSLLRLGMPPLLAMLLLLKLLQVSVVCAFLVQSCWST